MSKKINLNNSTVLLIGIIFIVIGLFVGFYEYFIERKDRAYSEMNILLYENEEPDNLESDSELDENIEPIEPEQPSDPEPEEQPSVPEQPKYNYIGILEIPKINLKRGFLDVNSRYNNVNYNLTVINGSTFPDQVNNNLILASHSGNCSVCYFNKLYKISKNDIAYVYYNKIKYQYKVVNIYEVEKDGTVAIKRNNNKNTLTLITCTKNSNTKQTVYILELTDKQNY